MRTQIHTRTQTHTHPVRASETFNKNHRLSSCVYRVRDTWRTIFSWSTLPLILPLSQTHLFLFLPLADRQLGRFTAAVKRLCLFVDDKL